MKHTQPEQITQTGPTKDEQPKTKPFIEKSLSELLSESLRHYGELSPSGSFKYRKENSLEIISFIDRSHLLVDEFAYLTKEAQQSNRDRIITLLEKLKKIRWEINKNPKIPNTLSKKARLLETIDHILEKGERSLGKVAENQ